MNNRRLKNSPSSQADIGASNRRAFDRFTYGRDALMTELDDFGNPGPSWKVRILDLSRAGLGVRSRRMVHEGRGVIIQLPGFRHGRPHLLFGVVSQSRYAPNEGYAIGVEFRALPTTTTIRNWLTSRGIAV